MKKKSTFSLLFKMGIVTIKNNLMQFLSIIAIGAIAVTLFVGLLANAQSIEERSQSAFSQGNLADLYVTTEKYDADDATSLKEIIGDDGELDSRLYFEAKAKSKSVDLAITKNLPAICKPYGDLDTDESYADDYFFLLDKELDSRNSVALISYSLGESVDVSIDMSSFAIDKTYVSILDSYVKEGGHNVLEDDMFTIKCTINGFMNHPENVQKAAYNTSTVLLSDKMLEESFMKVLNDNYQSSVVSYIVSAISSSTSFKTIDGQFSVPNQYLIKLNDASKAKDYQASIDSYFKGKETNNLTLNIEKEKMPFYMTIDNDAKQARQFTFIFPFVFFLVAILVILTTMSQIVLKDRIQIGTLKAIGVSRLAIQSHYCFLTGTLVALGTLIGEILGPIIIPGILGKKYTILYSLPARSYVFPYLYGILTAVIFLFVAVLVTYLICRHEVNLKPAESMRPAVKVVKMHGKSSQHEGPLKLSIKMAFRNIRMSLPKSIMVIVGVLGCSALLCCGFGIEDTIYHGIDNDLSKFENADISITYNSPIDYDSSIALSKDDSDITYNEPYSYTITSLAKEGEANNTTYLYVLSENNHHFQVDFDVDKVVVAEKVASKCNLQIGDTINFTYLGKTYQSEVGAIFKTFAHLSIVTSKDNPVYKDLPITYTGSFLDVKEGINPDTKAEALIKSNTSIASYQTNKTWNDHINDIISGFLVMTNAVKVFAILLAVVVLYNLSLMNFKEKTRDIATLKVLGFSRSEISLSLMFEILFLTLIGSLVGMALGYPFLLAVMKTNSVEIVQYLYQISFSSYIYSFLLTFVVAFIVNFIFTYLIRKVKMVESLKSVE